MGVREKDLCFKLEWILNWYSNIRQLDLLIILKLLVLTTNFVQVHFISSSGLGPTSGLDSQ